MAGQCSICTDEFHLTEFSALKCGHTFHWECIDQWIRKSVRPACPTCRRSITDRSEVIRQVFIDGNPSPTTEQVLELEGKVQVLEAALEKSEKEKDEKLAALENSKKENREKVAALEKMIVDLQTINRADARMNRNKTNELKEINSGLHDRIFELVRANRIANEKNEELETNAWTLRTEIGIMEKTATFTKAAMAKMDAKKLAKKGDTEVDVGEAVNENAGPSGSGQTKRVVKKAGGTVAAKKPKTSDRS